MRRLSRGKLEEIAENIFEAYKRLPGVNEQPVYRVCPEILAERLLGLKIDYQHLSMDDTILGLTSFESVEIMLPGTDRTAAYYFLDGNTILIESDLKKDERKTGRKNFTIFHEIGHQVLKRTFPLDYGTEFSKGVHFCKTKTTENRAIKDWEEWQCNVLGAAIFLPRELVKLVMFRFGIPEGIRTINNRCVREDYIRFIDMTKLFGCSKSVLAIRMSQLGYAVGDCLNDSYGLLGVEVE